MALRYWATDVMRVFLALELPADIRNILTALSRQLADSHADVKWVEESNLHVTLRFLGEIEEAQRQAVEQLVGQVAQRHAPFQISLGGVGAFPTLRSPRVVWIGVEQGKEQMTRLAADVEAGLGALGFPKEARAFSAHVTLGRVRSPKNLARLVDQLKTASWTPPAAFAADHLTLFRSTLSSVGSSYTPLARAPFARAT